VYGHCNICNIQIKHLQHTFETTKIFKTYTSNILVQLVQHMQHTFKIAEIFETYTCNICV
jgi:hypothetical protein